MQDQVGARLRAHGGLGAIQVDLAPVAPIERSYGAAAYQTLQTQLDELLLELKKQLRELAAAYAGRLEHYCLTAPLQWFNFFDYWGDAES